MPTPRPTLLNSSARAATSAELRFRIQARGSWQRAARVIALDGRAAEVLARVARMAGQASSFFVYEGIPGAEEAHAREIVLRRLDGDDRLAFRDALPDADFVFMLTTGESGAEAAARIGEACWRGNVTTGAIVIGKPNRAAEAVAAIRPHARVLLVTDEEDDVLALLTALRVVA